MSTRSMIGLQNDDGSITAIYCHFDGYIEDGVGEKLITHYTDISKIKELLSLGDISALGETTEHDPADWNSFGDIEGRCKIYADVEDDVSAQTYSMKEYEDLYNDYVDYLYLYKNGKWKVYNCSLWKNIEDVLNEESEEN